jgi:hypothetical protein
MPIPNPPRRLTIAPSTVWQLVFFLGIILFMCNLNALVDAVLHPDIPYFDEEHLIVGGVTGALSSLLFGLLMLYVHRLRKALQQIRTLEAILPICSHCKRIRLPGANPDHVDSWQPIEAYITARTATEFSHGICPECMKERYPQLYDRLRQQPNREA